MGYVILWLTSLAGIALGVNLLVTKELVFRGGRVATPGEATFFGVAIIAICFFGIYCLVRGKFDKDEDGEEE